MLNVKDYQFTVDWFSRNIPVWTQLFEMLKPKRILEIGSYEGLSTCFMIDHLSKNETMEIHCIDTWEGGIEHQESGIKMDSVETRFLNNVFQIAESVPCEISLQIHKGDSSIELVKLLADDKSNYFDFIYIDGSHQAHDVLTDAVLSFKLLRNGGIIAFDDYLWAEQLPHGIDPLRCPKIAIDAFTNIYSRQLKIIKAPLYQLYIQKI